MTTNGKHPRDAVILGAARTPIGKFLGALRDESAPPSSAAELTRTTWTK
jgi:acetyl-CoA acetyltransferase